LSQLFLVFQQRNRLWLTFQISVLILPLFPALGELGLVFVLLGLWRMHFQQIIRFNWLWLIIAVWLIVNSFFAEKPLEAWLGLANFLPFFALFVAIEKLIKTPEKLNRLAWLLIFPAIPIVILGLGQLYLNWSSPQLFANIFGWQLISQGVPPGRMSSAFIYANFLAIYLSFTFIISLGLWLSNWKRKKVKNFNLIILSTSLVFNALGLILANSRNSWLIVFLACCVFAIYLNWLISVITTIIIIVFGASFGNFEGQQWLRKIVPQLIWARLSDEMYPDRPVATLRIAKWQFCWSKIQERPFMGWGLRNFTPLYLEQTNYWFGHPHNLFIMLALEIGIVATVLFCLIIGQILVKVILLLSNKQKTQKTLLSDQDRLIVFTFLVAFISCILFNLFDVTLFDLRVNTISWILLAAIAGVSTTQRPEIRK
jgi:O-antigen ligase